MRQASKNLRGPLAVGGGLNGVSHVQSGLRLKKLKTVVVCAAPVGHGELARNCRYVFVFPPRMQETFQGNSSRFGILGR